MKNTNLNLTIIMGFIALTLMVSCNKEEKLVSDAKRPTVESRTVVNPVNENGTLKFNNENEYFAYLQFLDTELQQKTPDQVAADLYSNFNFTSRYTLDSNAEKEDHADSEGLLLNANYEYIVGDHVYVSKSPLETYRVKSNDNIGRATLQNMPYKGTLQPGQFGHRIEYVGPDKEVVFTGNGDCGCEIIITKTKSQSSTVVSLAISCPSSVLPLVSGTMNINWGDNSSQVVTVGASFPMPIFLSHTYGANTSPDQNYVPGPYNLTIEIPLNCGTGLSTQTIERKIVLNNVCCRKDFATKQTLISGNTRIDYKYTLVSTFWARSAKTEVWSYRLNNNGFWRELRANLKAGIDMNWRDENDCSAEFEQEEDGCSNCTYVVERLSGSKIQNKNITGEAIWKYSLIGNGTTILKDVSPNFCE